MAPAAVYELDLDLEAFEGPFDLLLTLLLKEELEPREVDVVGIVLAFVERLSERDEADLEACGEFLVLVAALLELKARLLFPDEAAVLDALEPEEAAEELARRLAEYRQMKEAAAWLAERLAAERGRFFRLGPAPVAPRGERRLAPQSSDALAAALRALAAFPPNVSLGHMALRFPPVSQFVERFRSLLGRRRRFDFDSEVEGLSRVEQAVAFLALLELRKSGEIALSQAAPFAPIRVSRLSHEVPGSSRAKEVPGFSQAPAVSEPERTAGLELELEPVEGREAGFRPSDSERTSTWTARSA
ncbi:MAG TPA: segregation/condensation protein A [Gaiellaceae bacterium]|nr:segregation/condensation protein A [Gaiellaceae bacterium]